MDLVMKDFYTRLFHNKIKSPAQRVKYEQVENNGLCRECPINVKDTIFHQLFECHDNKTLLMKLKEEYIAIDNLNLSLHAFLTNTLSENSSLAIMGHIMLLTFAKTLNSSNYRRILKWPHLKITFLITLKKILIRDIDIRTRFGKLADNGAFTHNLTIDLNRLV